MVPPYHDTDSTLPPRTTYYSDIDLQGLGSDNDKPMLIALHGLSGSSHEVYLRHVVEPLYREGFEACVVNARGCAQSKPTSHLLFNARATWDIRQLVKWLRNMFPNRALFAIGFSLGGNILVNERSKIAPEALQRIQGTRDSDSIRTSSILVKKARSVCSRLLSCARTIGTWILEQRPYREPGSDLNCIRREWELI